MGRCKKMIPSLSVQTTCQEFSCGVKLFGHSVRFSLLFVVALGLVYPPPAIARDAFRCEARSTETCRFASRDPYGLGTDEVLRELRQNDLVGASSQAHPFASEVGKLQYERSIERQLAANQAQVQGPTESDSPTPQIPQGRNYGFPARAVLLEADQTQPMGNRSQGLVNWRSRSIIPYPGGAPTLAVEAKVEFPESHLAMYLSVGPNDDLHREAM
jgi:hypothetical protein